MASKWKAGTLVAATHFIHDVKRLRWTERQRPLGQQRPHRIRHVLLISIDGMHAMDFSIARRESAESMAARPIAPTSPSSAETASIT